MKTLSIEKINLEDLEEIHNYLKNKCKDTPVYIDESRWNFAKAEKANFQIARNSKAIYIYYNIKEKQTIAKHSKPNSSVWLDSCVEFFLKINDKQYQNFEINCCGTALSAIGESRDNRVFLEVEDIVKIKTISSLDKKNLPFKLNNTDWDITIKIPYDIIKTSHDFEDKKEYFGNFYNCNESSDYPHFLTWNKVETEEPDFHRPEYFGKITLN